MTLSFVVFKMIFISDISSKKLSLPLSNLKIFIWGCIAFTIILFEILDLKIVCFVLVTLKMICMVLVALKRIILTVLSDF